MTHAESCNEETSQRLLQSNASGDGYSESQRSQSTGTRSTIASIPEDIALEQENNDNAPITAEPDTGVDGDEDGHDYAAGLCTSGAVPTMSPDLLVDAPCGDYDAGHLSDPTPVGLAESTCAQAQLAPRADSADKTAETRPLTADSVVSVSQINLEEIAEDASHRFKLCTARAQNQTGNANEDQAGMNEDVPCMLHCVASGGAQEEEANDVHCQGVMVEYALPPTVDFNDVAPQSCADADPFPGATSRPNMHDGRQERPAGQPASERAIAADDGSASIPALSSIGHSVSGSIAESIECESDSAEGGVAGTDWSSINSTNGACHE